MQPRDVAACLETIGARETSALVREGGRVFPGAGPSPDNDLRENAVEQLDLPALDRLDELDLRVAARTEDLCKLALQYYDVE